MPRIESAGKKEEDVWSDGFCLPSDSNLEVLNTCLPMGSGDNSLFFFGCSHGFYVRYENVIIPAQEFMVHPPHSRPGPTVEGLPGLG